MHSIKLEISDFVFDKVMFFLNNISKRDLVIKEIDSLEKKEKSDDLVSFFKSSPLYDNTLYFEREQESYKERVVF